jgi:hypothetical protein
MPFPQIDEVQQFDILNPFLTKSGKPGKVQPGSVVWASSDESVAKVVPNADEVTAKVVAQAVPADQEEGKYTITVSGDADLGEGVKTVVGSESGVVVSSNKTVSVSLKAGPVEEQP